MKDITKINISQQEEDESAVRVAYETVRAHWDLGLITNRLLEKGLTVTKRQVRAVIYNERPTTEVRTEVLIEIALLTEERLKKAVQLNSAAAKVLAAQNN